jgi:CspA family cold shock protein
MPNGKIKKVVIDKGYGFIQGEGGADVFFHHSTVADRRFEDLVEGQRVEYTLDGENARGAGKGPRAAKVVPADA